METRVRGVLHVVLGALVCACTAVSGAVRGDDTVAYEVRANFATGAKRIDVAMRFSVADRHGPVSLQAPVWAPGDYHLQNFGKYVTTVQAHAGDSPDGAQIRVEHSNETTWTFDPAGAREVTVTYAIPSEPAGFFSENVQVTDTQVFLNGPAAYLYVEDGKKRPTSLTVHVPGGWHAEFTEVGGERAEGDALTVNAIDYDTLADSPFMMSLSNMVVTADFTVGETSVRAVFFDHPERIANPQQYADVLKAVLTAESVIMGGMPTKQYKFLFDVDGPGGGLEHLNCTRIAFPAAIPAQFLAPYAGHEAFHMWDVKRIRPRVLGPFDYIDPPKTRNLWFAEGVTEYYAHVATRRAGITDEQRFLTHWSQVIRSFKRNPQRLKVSADESSLRVWEAGNSQGFGISYYTKGELIGLCLDLRIRHDTLGARSLDDVMRLMMLRYGLPKPGYGEDDIRKTVNEVAGEDLTQFYNVLARSTEEMPFAECLGYAGLNEECTSLPTATADQLALRKAWSAQSAAEAN